MGTWGVAVFADDLAADVRADWREAILDGLDPVAASDRLEGSYAQAITDSDESVVFWLALAAAQMETGRLLDSVRDRAVAIIDAGADLARWDEDGRAKQRANVLGRLRAKLVGPQSPAKRLRRTPYHGVQFDPGDVVLLRNPANGERGLVYVVDRSDSREPDTVIEILVWDGGELPVREELATLSAARLHPGAGLGRDGRPKPLFYRINTWRGREDAFGAHLGEVVAKGVSRPTLADWRQGALNPNAPCYTVYGLSWPRLVSGIGKT